MSEVTSKLTKPDWFDLEKYKDLSNLSAINWATLLTQRLFLYDGRYGPPSRRYGLSIPEIVKLRVKIFISIEQDPLNPYPFEFGKKLPGLTWDFRKSYEELFEGKRFSKLFQKNIRPLTVDQVCVLNEHIPEEAKNAFKNIKLPENFEDPIFREFYYRPIDSICGKFIDDRLIATVVHNKIDSLVHILVNLSAPDNQIINDFRTFLKEVRKLSTPSLTVKFNKTLLKRLCNNKVLPYLDLMLWADNEFDIKILNRKLGSWLYPDESDEFDAVDRVRKTTQDLAEKSMEYEFIEALAKIKE